MGCCNCKDAQLGLVQFNKYRNESIDPKNESVQNTSFELQTDKKTQSKMATLDNSARDSVAKKENSTTAIPSLRNEDLFKSSNTNENEEIKSNTKITNLKSSCVSNKGLNHNRTSKLKSYINNNHHHDLQNKWTPHNLNISKNIITEKDSKKEDSDRTEKGNQSILKNNNKIIENLLKTNESNFSRKSRKMNSRISHIASETSQNFERGSKKDITLKTNKSPKLINKARAILAAKKSSNSQVSKNAENNNKASSNQLNNSIDTLNRYKHIFADVDCNTNSPSKSLRSNHKARFLKRSVDFSEDGDLSSVNRNQEHVVRAKMSSNVPTFRKDMETIRKGQYDEFLNGDILHVSDNNITRFHCNDYFK